MYGGLWEIEETFRVLKSDLRARPVYVWTDEHVRGHFALCFLSLCLIRYIQYRVREFSNKNLSCEVIGQTLYDASAIVFGEWPLIHLVPNNISEDFVLIQKAMDMPPLLTAMTRSEFKRITQLDIADNYPID